MPALTIVQTAKRFGLSTTTVSRWTLAGDAKVCPGGKGRSNHTLIDSVAFAELLRTHRRTKRLHRSKAVIDQLTRGARALTVAAAVKDELKWALEMDDLIAFNIPADKRAKVLKNIERRVIGRIHQHLKIPLGK